MKEAHLTGTTGTTGVSEDDAENGNTENGNTDLPPTIVDNMTDLAITDEKVDNAETEEEPVPSKRVYRYKDGQWAPHHPQGAKRYDPEFLLQLQDDPLSKKKPENLPADVAKFDRPDGFFSLSSISRPANSESFLPGFAKIGSPKRGMSQRDHRDTRKSSSMMSKNMTRGGAPGGTGGQGGPAPNKVFRVSLSLGDDIKLNKSENAWKPKAKKELKNSQIEGEDDEQELYKKFRGILNKLTPQKFEKLLDQVKDLEINTQPKLEGVINLVFQKAIDEPAFSEAYAAMCQRLSMLAVPLNNTSNQLVNFRKMLINRCQKQFETKEVDEAVQKLEKEIESSTDPAKQKELKLMLDEEHRRVRMRSVGNIRFIGELYKLKMLNGNIMVYCMNYLIDKLEEEKLECLCKLVSTIGQQLDGEAKSELDSVFKRMQDIINQSKKGKVKISSRVRFMLQDTIELRLRKWVPKSVIQAGPKTLDQIQKEAEQQHREIEIINSGPGNDRRGGGRDSRDGRDGRRGDSRRGGSSNYSDWPQNTQTKTKFVVDTSKFKAGVNNSNKSLNNIKLGPPTSMWNQGSGAKPVQSKPIAPAAISNMFSVLDTGMDTAPSYQPKGSSMEKTSIRVDSSGGRSTSMEAPKPTPSALKPVEPALPTAPEPLTEKEKMLVQSTIDQSLSSPNDEELASEIKEKFIPSKHAGVVTEIFNLIIEKPIKTYPQLSKSLHYLISSKTISINDFIVGFADILDFAPDLHIDMPKFYDVLAMFITPHLVSKHITLQEINKSSEKIIAEQHGHLFLAAILEEVKKAMGPTYANTKWIESGLKFSDWMNEENSVNFKEDSRFSFLEGNTPLTSEPKKLSAQETQQTLLKLFITDQSLETVRGWVKDNVGKASDEDWFMRSLIQAICEYAIFGAAEHAVPRFNQDRMGKYIQLINDFGVDRSTREMNCLIGIQKLLSRLEHPRGVALDIFQYLSDNYIIMREAFLAFETSEQEPEGKAVMLKALVSFYTDIKEPDNEDSGSED